MAVSSASETMLSIAQIVPVTQAEGPGIRFALWFQGCPLRCPGCCNPEMLPFEGGKSMRVSEVLQQFEQAQQLGVEGITLLGGEPFAHVPGAAVLARQVRARGGSVMVFSGFTLEELHDRHDSAIEELLACTDILVDGPYVRELPDFQRRWIGSTNQRIHFLTSRYHFDSRWNKANTLEIRLEAGVLTVNGFPAKQASGLWKRPRFRRSLPQVEPPASNP